MKRVLPAALIFATAVLTAAGQEMPVPAGLQAQIFVKVLLFDKAYELRSQDGFVVAVLYQDGFRSSYLAKEEFAAAVPGWSGQTPGAGPFSCVAIDVDRTDDLPAALAAAGADMLYVAPLRSYDVGRIARAARDLRLPAFTGVPEYLNAGLAISLDLRQDKPRIVVNRRAALEQGAELDSRILSLARIVEDDGRREP